MAPAIGAPHTLHARITQSESNVRTSRVGVGGSGGWGWGAELSACWCDSVGLLAPPSSGACSDHGTSPPELVEPKLSRYPTSSTQTSHSWPGPTAFPRPEQDRGMKPRAPLPQAPRLSGRPGTAPALHPPLAFPRLREAVDTGPAKGCGVCRPGFAFRLHPL